MKNLFVRPEQSIKDALKHLSRGGEKCLIVVDSSQKFLGTISDGDVRRSILDGKRFDTSIVSVYNKNATYVEKGRFSITQVKSIFLKDKFDLIPVIDKSKRVVDILFWDKIFRNERKLNDTTLSLPVVTDNPALYPTAVFLTAPLVPV